MLYRKAVSLFYFDDKATFTIGEIEFPIFTKGINLYSTFLVISSKLAYNVILGRPLINEIKAIPSTYHQLIMFPTTHGITHIKKEQNSSKECYTNCLKQKEAEE